VYVSVGLLITVRGMTVAQGDVGSVIKEERNGENPIKNRDSVDPLNLSGGSIQRLV
jgi:hypothetical protein